jgi:hypothetical protein
VSYFSGDAASQCREQRGHFKGRSGACAFENKSAFDLLKKTMGMVIFLPFVDARPAALANFLTEETLVFLLLSWRFHHVDN